MMNAVHTQCNIGCTCQTGLQALTVTDKVALVTAIGLVAGKQPCGADRLPTESPGHV